MTDNVIHERYRELACSIIKAEAIRFINAPNYTDYSFYKWLNECVYFDYLGIDREYFYVKTLKKKAAKGKGDLKVRKKYAKKV